MNENAKQKATAAAVIAHRGAILQALASHIGEPHAIGMGELYELVYGESWRNRINDTRPLRKIITDLRDEGVPINSVASSRGGGYYYAAAGSEMEGYLKREKARAKRIFKRCAAISKVTLPNYVGQCLLEWEADGNEAA